MSRRYTDTICATQGDRRFHVSTHDEKIGHDVFVSGSFDLEAMTRAMEALGTSVAGRTVLDLGANIGTSTVEFIRRFGAARVVSVEADPDNFKLLRLNVIENYVDEQVTALNLAVSDAAGIVEISRSVANWGDHRILQKGHGDAQVPSDTLDNLVEALGVVDLEATALLWMDVQGHEAQVFAGASKLLDAGIPVITEFWPDLLSERLAAMEKVIAERFTSIIDLGSPWTLDAHPTVLPAGDVTTLAATYRGDAFTDLVLIP